MQPCGRAVPGTRFKRGPTRTMRPINVRRSAGAKGARPGDGRPARRSDPETIRKYLPGLVVRALRTPPLFATNLSRERAPFSNSSSSSSAMDIHAWDLAFDARDGRRPYRSRRQSHDGWSRPSVSRQRPGPRKMGKGHDGLAATRDGRSVRAPPQC